MTVSDTTPLADLEAVTKTIRRDIITSTKLDQKPFFGLLSATTRAPRGLRCSVKRLIDPPLPAASRPSKTSTWRLPLSLAQYWNFSSSTCSSHFSTS